MKIVELRASGFARLRAVEIRPDGALVPVVGKNSAGKSSVLRAIWTALEGRAAAPPRPINEDAEEAVIRLDLGELKVTRRFKRGKDKDGDYTTDLAVQLANGKRVDARPQAMIDALLGDLSFDPLAFAKMKPAEQFAALRQLVSGFDFEATARKRQALYEDRTAHNRSARKARATAEGLVLPPGPRPELVDTVDLTRQLTLAHEANNRRRFLSDDILATRKQAERQLDEAEDLRSRATALEEHAAKLQERASQEEAALPVSIDVAPIAAQLANAETTNKTARLFQVRDDWETVAEESEDAARLCTEEIADLDKAQQAAIAAAALPGGLRLILPAEGDPEVALGTVPFGSAGTAERIIASVGVGMALNPQLRVMLVDEGSELDREHLELLAKLASQNSFQIWIAKVDEAEEGPGFHIVDGSVAAVPSKSRPSSAGVRSSIEHSDPGLR